VNWIQKIFTEFKLIYGPGMISSMLGTDEREMMNVMQGWAEKLAYFKDHPTAIKYALENLPKDYPPNLLQFRDICREGIKHSPKPLALEHRMTPEQLHKNKIRIKPRKDRRWIYNLARRVIDGQHVSWSVERILKEAQEIEFKEHPGTYREWMGKQIV